MEKQIPDIGKNTDDTVFSLTDEKRFSCIYNKKPVDHGNTINADEQPQQEPNIFFSVKKTMNQNIIDKVGSYNLENPVAEVVDNRFFKKSRIIFPICFCRSKQK